jgi:hypothetical protein
VQQLSLLAPQSLRPGPPCVVPDVAGSVEHAAIQKRGSDGAVVIRTDAGVTEVVAVGNLFETADEARAARYR